MYYSNVHHNDGYIQGTYLLISNLIKRGLLFSAFPIWVHYSSGSRWIFGLL